MKFTNLVIATLSWSSVHVDSRAIYEGSAENALAPRLTPRGPLDNRLIGPRGLFPRMAPGGGNQKAGSSNPKASDDKILKPAQIKANKNEGTVADNQKAIKELEGIKFEGENRKFAAKVHESKLAPGETGSYLDYDEHGHLLGVTLAYGDEVKHHAAGIKYHNLAYPGYSDRFYRALDTEGKDKKEHKENRYQSLYSTDEDTTGQTGRDEKPHADVSFRVEGPDDNDHAKAVKLKNGQLPYDPKREAGTVVRVPASESITEGVLTSTAFGRARKDGLKVRTIDNRSDKDTIPPNFTILKGPTMGGPWPDPKYPTDNLPHLKRDIVSTINGQIDNGQTNDHASLQQDFEMVYELYDELSGEVQNLMWPIIQNVTSRSNDSGVWDAMWSIMAQVTPGISFIGSFKAAGSNLDAWEQVMNETYPEDQVTPKTEQYKSDVRDYHYFLEQTYNDTWHACLDALTPNDLLKNFENVTNALAGIGNDTSLVPPAKLLVSENDHSSDYFLNGPWRNSSVNFNSSSAARPACPVGSNVVVASPISTVTR